jgi:light-regulated signal transduction histidine kinase (bacteriophytochrome)
MTTHSSRLAITLLAADSPGDQIPELNEALEARVRQRTAQLEAANRELESYSYKISHDLRAPLRYVACHVSLLLELPSIAADEEARGHADCAIKAVARLRQLIEDLLHFSCMGEAALRREPFSMTELVAQLRCELEPEIGNRTVTWQVNSLPDSVGDASMLRQVWQNLILNAIKYTRPRAAASIEIGAYDAQAEHIYYVKDNGVGFDPGHAGRLFNAFERLHSRCEFEGNGIGLANVRRIIQCHRGRVWAVGDVDRGAAFFFSLPKM